CRTGAAARPATLPARAPRRRAAPPAPAAAPAAAPPTSAPDCSCAHSSHKRVPCPATGINDLPPSGPACRVPPAPPPKDAPRPGTPRGRSTTRRPSPAPASHSRRPGPPDRPAGGRTAPPPAARAADGTGAWWLQKPKGPWKTRHYAASVGTPSKRTPLPPAFGISTAFTGGGKYEPDDIRFQIWYRFRSRSASNSQIDCSSTPAAPLFAW